MSLEYLEVRRRQSEGRRRRGRGGCGSQTRAPKVGQASRLPASAKPTQHSRLRARGAGETPALLWEREQTRTHDNLWALGREYCARKRCRRCALPPHSMTLAGSRCRLVCAIRVQRRLPFFLPANFSVIISVLGSVKWMAAVMDAPVPPSWHYGATRRRRKAGFIGIWRKCL